MKWERRKSDKFEDRRGMSGGKKTLLGGGVVGIIALLLTMFGGETGQMIGTVLQQVQPAEQTASGTQTRELSEEEKTLGDFSEFAFDTNNETWTKIFAQNGLTYQEPGMVLFDDGVSTACGNASSAVGPFYCPADRKVYMDLRFFDELYNRFGAKEGNFAIAYVIAHEMGHHVQNLLGTNEKVRQAQQQTNQINANKLSVAQELQADFYAGVWAAHNQKWLESGDIEVAISAATAVGDDAIQRRVQGEVNPDSFTHGTSKQRVEWFMKGYQTKDISQGDTFSALLR